MSILLMPDHGETAYLADTSLVDTVINELERFFGPDSRCTEVVLGTRESPATETCDHQYVVFRGQRVLPEVRREIAARVSRHVAYVDPLADKGLPADPHKDRHPTVDASYDDLAAPFQYDKGAALKALLESDYTKALYHLNRLTR